MHTSTYADLPPALGCLSAWLAGGLEPQRRNGSEVLLKPSGESVRDAVNLIRNLYCP